MARKKKRAPRTFPPVPPADQILERLGELEDFMRRHNDREAQRERNGKPSADRDPARVALRQAVMADLARQIEADDRPITERVPEYVLGTTSGKIQLDPR